PALRGDGHGRQSVRTIADAELPVIVAAPARETPVLEQARVVLPGDDRGPHRMIDRRAVERRDRVDGGFVAIEDDRRVEPAGRGRDEREQAARERALLHRPPHPAPSDRRAPTHGPESVTSLSPTTAARSLGTARPPAN